MHTEELTGSLGMGRGETGEGVDNVAYDPYKTDSYMGHTPNPNNYKPLWQQSRYRTTPYEKKYGFAELWND
jgi:hypothetical protein